MGWVKFINVFSEKTLSGFRSFSPWGATRASGGHCPPSGRTRGCDAPEKSMIGKLGHWRWGLI